MTDARKRQAAKAFSETWGGRGYEKGESQKFWIDLLCNVFGVRDFARFIQFESQIKDTFGGKTVTNFIDAYIPSTKVMIEQKSSSKDPREPIRQSDGTLLTPFQQARKYIAGLPLSQHPRWVVVCNFETFLIHDMEKPNGEPEEIRLANLEKEYYRLEFLVELGNESVRREEEISVKAGELVKKLYDALIAEYVEPTAESLRSLNVLCVRLVFCLYAEDAGLFATRTAFEDYIKSFSVRNVRMGLIELFKALDTKTEERDKYDETTKPFPYVNGGLFRDEKIEIPNFTREIVDVLVDDCAAFDWSEISPTIFGAVFESTLNPETRRSGGMHYTSVENIHKVIDPLFMDGLNAEFEAIAKTAAAKTRREKLAAFQEKLGALTFLDPACGSGNFLTEAFLSLRRLENKVISFLRENEAERLMDFDHIIRVKINQFYGIEINDFAVTVAKTALWIAESQMTAETERIVGSSIRFLPLATNAFIVEGNALAMDWATLRQADGNAMMEDGLFAGIATRVDGGARRYDYIMGNPPFVGARMMGESQKSDVLSVWGDARNTGNVDYVSCWYKKAADLIKKTETKCAFVSTNSITQGEQVAIMWKPLMKEGIEIDFAYRTFRWDSDSTQKAHVHCVIIAFSRHADSLSPTQNKKKKFIAAEDGTKAEAENINGYLIDAPDVFIESRNKPLFDVPEIGIGNKPIDGGNYLFTENEMNDFIKKEPESATYFQKWYGSDEFINNRPRFCLWLGGCSPAELRKMPECMKRVQAVRDFRLASKSAGTVKLADRPTRFHVENMPENSYIIIPRVSSERRRYIPMGYLNPDSLTSDSAHIIPNATLYHFGVLTSNVHMAWMRAVCGRLKSDYRYSKDIVYNNFPWPDLTILGGIEHKEKISQTAQGILDARALYPDCSLADLYDETTMPPELRRAHQANDRAVMAAYGFGAKMTESEIVANLFRMYEKLTT